MDGKLNTAGDQSGRLLNDVASRGDYMNRVQGMVDGIQDVETREAAQSALDEVGRDLGFEAGKDTVDIDKSVDKERGFERET